MTAHNVMELVGVYSTAEQALIEPHGYITIDHFFIDFWLPLLGPDKATAALVLQRAAFDATHPKQAQAMAKLDADPLLRWFVPTRFQKFMYDREMIPAPSPTPTLVAGLQREIEARLAANESLTEILDSLMGELWQGATHRAMLARLCAGETDLTTSPRTIYDVVVGFDAPAGTKAVREKAQEIDRRTTSLWCQDEPGYFFNRWRVLVGLDGFWLLLLLRRHFGSKPFSVTKKELTAGLGIDPDRLDTALGQHLLREFFVNFDYANNLLTGTIPTTSILTPADKLRAETLEAANKNDVFEAIW